MLESSYDVTFAHGDDDGDDDNNCEDENFDGCADDAPPSGVEVLASHGRGRRRMTGTQVVHRHPNGLCVITAGNVLELSMGGVDRKRPRRRRRRPPSRAHRRVGAISRLGGRGRAVSQGKVAREEQEMA